MKKQEEKRHHVNIGTIGHVDHGKTALTQAILQTLHMRDGENPVDLTKDEPSKTLKKGIEIKSVLKPEDNQEME